MQNNGPDISAQKPDKCLSAESPLKILTILKTLHQPDPIGSSVDD